MASQKLFSEFPPVPTDDWTNLIQKDLKGADFDKKLVWETQEGFKVRPFYRKEDLKGKEWLLSNLPGKFPYSRSTRKLANDWNIRQDIDATDLSTAKSLAEEAIQNGVSSLGFVIANSVSDRKGIPVTSKKDLGFLLQGLPLSEITLHFVAEERSPEIYSWLPKDKKLVGGLGYDPYRILARKGKSGGHGPETLLPILKESSKTSEHFRGLTVHSSTFRDSGSTIVQELAYTLALGSEYLFRLGELGLSPEVVNSQTIFQFSVGPDYFLEIAKFRAARTLWAEIFSAYSSEKGEKSLPFLSAETARYNYGIYDLHNNILRGTTEAISAAIGGAEIIQVLPFDHLLQPADSFSLRIARNVQLLLKHESYLDKVADPSSGSYYIETITDSITEQAWKLFSEIEKDGGFLAALQSGKIQASIRESRKKKEENYSTRREIFLGTNQYPNAKDRIQNKDLNKNLQSPALTSVSGEIVCDPIPEFFAGDAIEEIRILTENWESKNKSAVKALLLPLGDLKMKKARAIFSLNFLGCAGITTIDPGSYESAEEALAGIAKENPQVVVFCSSDEEVSDWVAKILPKIQGTNKPLALVAGYPKDTVPALEAAGIGGFLHVKSNLLETLTDLQKRLGIR
ncbi:methylmalonyl-CoA mutase [Leptospira wolffii]|uniref:methylmalonyl-CoA mutase family protein n=1 Tax=Leptospira wolffii TaxID=409998 RepID=UPI0010823E51|nr:methylmalonyl-CoA mutase family protein [Leptospira wolffii]TGK59398.1 methylmalonyl-CoA mutase [Leptospira wolffii]TGK71219.1 methylmalonyl-CoA mutase [Leptospira wolffii]TGK77787.1 methylmalonyl-CoA mutase [Leptospira wolffii]TGL29503.1 methylmalonyl-CoA mutase [Leptospira wolffii]